MMIKSLNNNINLYTHHLNKIKLRRDKWTRRNIKLKYMIMREL